MSNDCVRGWGGKKQCTYYDIEHNRRALINLLEVVTWRTFSEKVTAWSSGEVDGAREESVEPYKTTAARYSNDAMTALTKTKRTKNYSAVVSCNSS